MNKSYIVLLLLFLFSCGETTKPARRNFIDLEAGLAVPEKMKLSSVVSSLEYVPLETGDSCLLPFHNGFYITGDYILALPRGDNNVPVLFDRQGRYLRKIGRMGKGPGEMIGYSEGAFLNAAKNRFALYVGNQVMYFGVDGKFIESFRVDFDSLYYDRIATAIVPSIALMGNGERMLLFDMHVDSTRVFTVDARAPQNKVRVPGVYGVWSAFSFDPDSPLMHAHTPWKAEAMYMPTIRYGADYAVYYDGQYCRYYHFYYDGRVERLYDLRVPVLPNGKNTLISSIVETDRYLFFGLSGSDSYFCLYDRQKDKLHCLEKFAYGMENDLDSGIPFWPDGIAPDGKLYMHRDALWFKKEAAKSKSAAFRAFAEKIEDDDNHVLIFATLR